MRSTDPLLIHPHHCRTASPQCVGAAVVAVTLVAGTALLRATLVVRSGSLVFGVVGASCSL